MIPNGNRIIVDQVVDRQHVSTSDVGIIRAIRSALREGPRTDPALRDLRKDLYRAGLATHHANQDLYDFVMKGA